MDLPANVDDLTLNTPAIDFDSSGAFDTGKISLPSFDFDGVPVSNETDGPKSENYLRLRRTEAGKVSFTTKAVLEPFDNCEGDFSLTIERPASGSLSVDGSMTSNFCVLPFTLSMGYDSGRSTCQFFFEADGWRVLFGRSSGGGLCAEVWTGTPLAWSGGPYLGASPPSGGAE